MTIKELTRDQLDNHGETYQVIARVIAYVMGLWGCMLLADTYLGDTYFGNLSLFLIFSVVFELIWAGCACYSHATRLVSYLICVILIGVVSLTFLKQADSQASSGQPAQTKSNEKH
jgi:hypothetical protein